MIWRFLLIPQFIILIVLSESLNAQEKFLDDFENLSGWKTIVSDGVTATIASAPGHTGKAMMLDFEFHGGI